MTLNPFHSNPSIQQRIFLLFTATAFVIVAAAGVMLRYEVRQSLEAELGHKLEAVAHAAAVQFSAAELEIITAMPGPRTAATVTEALQTLKAATGVQRIYWFATDGRALADTDSSVAPGDLYFHLQFHPGERAAVQQGRSAHSMLFDGVDGRPTMTGFAPLISKGRLFGGVAVDGNASFLGSMRSLERKLLGLAAASLFLTLFLAGILARTLSRPISALSKSAKAIGRGELDTPVPAHGSGELADLSAAMEEMRTDLADRERTLKTMVAGVAHEIRNPVGGMQLFAGLLEDEIADRPAARAHLDRITREMAQIKRIVDHFLDFARPRRPLAEPVALAQLVAEAVELAAPPITDRLTVHIDAAHTAFADPGQLRQVLINLIDNANQATHGSGEIAIETESASPECILIRVKDSGPGIAPELVDKLFDPFFTTRAQGTGLGLSIAGNLMRRNSGRLILKSTGASGTVFEISLPSKPLR